MGEGPRDVFDKGKNCLKNATCNKIRIGIFIGQRFRSFAVGLEQNVDKMYLDIIYLRHTFGLRIALGGV